MGLKLRAVMYRSAIWVLWKCQAILWTVGVRLKAWGERFEAWSTAILVGPWIDLVLRFEPPVSLAPPQDDGATTDPPVVSEIPRFVPDDIPVQDVASDVPVIPVLPSSPSTKCLH